MAGCALVVEAEAASEVAGEAGGKEGGAKMNSDVAEVEAAAEADAAAVDLLSRWRLVMGPAEGAERMSCEEYRSQCLTAYGVSEHQSFKITCTLHIKSRRK